MTQHQTQSTPVERDDHATNPVSTAHHHYIGDIDQAPQFMIDNSSITDGYRINFNTPTKILKSLFMVHNELVNIWTHFLPAIFFIIVLISFFFVIDESEFKQSFYKYREEVEKSIGNYHSKLRNLSSIYNGEAEDELNSLKISILEGYEDMLNTIEEKSERMKELLNYNIEGFKITVNQELHKKLAQFQKSKRKYEEIIAPQIIFNFKNSINGSFANMIKDHLEELKQHLDSSIFQVIELHQETPNPEQISRWPIFVFLSTAVICLCFSTVFHLFHPISSKTYGLLLRFDFAGISLLIAGSAFPAIYYGMYCQFAVASLYLTWTFSMAFLCFVVCLFEWILKQGNQIYRSFLFGGFGLTMFVPLTHMVINDLVYDNYGDSYEFSTSLIYYIMLATSYTSGLYIFTVKCPERNNPGKYNICGHSHQIWHVMVVLGVISTYFAVLQNFQMRKMSVCSI